MPSHSAKQARFMQAAAHNPEFAKKADIPVKVAQEFAKADKKEEMAKALVRQYG
jgi:hypothetical protein